MSLRVLRRSSRASSSGEIFGSGMPACAASRSTASGQLSPSVIITQSKIVAISPSLTSSRRGGQASWQPKAQTFVEGASVQEVGERDVLRYQPRGVDENSLVIAFATLLRARNQFVNLGI